MPVRSFREEDPVHHFGSQALCSPLPTISQLLPESLPEAFLPKAELLPQNSTPRPQQWSEHFLPCVIISFLLLRFTSSYPMYLPPRSTVLLRPGSSSPPGICLPEFPLPRGGWWLHKDGAVVAPSPTLTSEPYMSDSLYSVPGEDTDTHTLPPTPGSWTRDYILCS